MFRITSEVLGEAERWGVAPNIAKAVRPPHPDRPDLRIPTVEEWRSIREVVRGSIAEGPTVIAGGCGLRLGEALALRKKDVDLDRSRLRVSATMYRGGRTQPKTARSRRTVSMPGFVVRYLREHLTEQAERRLRSVAWSDGDYVFDSGGGIPMSIESVSRRFGQLVEAIGLGQIRFHDLRHAYATRLLEAGVHPKIVSDALGHASISITLDTYSHVMPSMSDKAAEAIEAVLGGER